MLGALASCALVVLPCALLLCHGPVTRHNVLGSGDPLQVALYNRSEALWATSLDAAIFQQLPKLTCLTLTGYFAPPDTRLLPTTLSELQPD